ncbi:asparagine synthase-related protein [Sporosarcina sp. 179-K 8C2 HS]|uniref:asparagine synthase-related protein n=1 Tax=Sporosarcina sp. 179-K 8C2 HS TaxID=3142387 RepID=UPI0039A1B4E4
MLNGVLNKVSTELHFHEETYKQSYSYSENFKEIAFSGKLYNAQKLKKKLLTRNHLFKTDSDSEVILKAYYNQNQISRLVKNKPISTFNVDQQLYQYFHNLNTNESVNRMMYTAFKFVLPNDMLVKTDWMSKINGLEIKTPFLDHRVLELAYKVPLNFKMRGAKGKIILKETYSDLLPNDILFAKKRGFEIPLAEWFKTELKELVVSSLTKEKVEKANLVHFDTVETIIDEHMKSKKNHANLIWSLIVLHKWHENFLGKVEGGRK